MVYKREINANKIPPFCKKEHPGYFIGSGLGGFKFEISKIPLLGKEGSLSLPHFAKTLFECSLIIFS